VRVLFVTHNFPRFAGDLPGNFLLRLAKALRAHDVDVRALAPHAAGLAASEVVDGIQVDRFRYAADERETLAYGGTMAAQVGGSWAARMDLVGLLRSAGRAVKGLADRADVVHAHWWCPAGLAVTRHHRRIPPVITTMHGSDVRFGVQSLPGRLLMKQTLRRSARATAVSRYLADEAERISGRPVVVAPMPVDAGIFTPAPESRDGLLFVGKIDGQKGLSILIDALAVLPATVSLTVIGDGVDADRCRAQAARLGVTHRIRWMGALPHDELPAHYRRAQLLVAPATEPEGLGLVGVEALLCETPVIASDIGGLRDVVEHEHSGLLVNPREPAALARAITVALGDAEQMKRWGREGRTSMLARFGPEACAAAYVNVYREARDARA
jgi:glycosyltransferase involved in cell wall biosynthesis